MDGCKSASVFTRTRAIKTAMRCDASMHAVWDVWMQGLPGIARCAESDVKDVWKLETEEEENVRRGLGRRSA